MVVPYIIGEIIAKDNLNIEYLMQTFKNLFLSKITNANSSNILLTNSPLACVIKVCSNGGTIYIIFKLIAKDNYNAL